MNKFFKVILAILGGVNTAFSVIVPIFIAFLIINMYPDLGSINQQIILWGGYLSSLYRAISLWRD
jgi:hypothetical protein|tara:strand:+ start:593 stop:787 length:195 start_codon:yes stop_codon:yes gene_type:complete